MYLKNNLKHTRHAPLGFVLASMLAPGAQALHFEPGNMEIELDTEITYAAQWRVQGRDKRLEAAINGNDGNSNFDPGLVSNRLGARVELLASLGDWSAFGRAVTFYDDVYENGDTDMNDANYLTYNNGFAYGGDVALGDFPDQAVYNNGSEFRVLDSYVQYAIPWGGGGSLRIGRQVISWGEGTFFGSLNTLQNSFDAVAATAPGAEVKEILLPTGGIWAQYNLTGSLSAELYYQYEYQQVLEAPAGHYFSKSDVTGPGASRLIVAPATITSPGAAFIRTEDDQPSDSGQWGAAGRYFMENGIELALFFVKSHAKFPFLSLDAANGAYTNVYSEDIRSYGATMSTLVGNASVLIDVMYSPNMHFQKQAPLPEVVRGHLFQASIGLTDTLGQGMFYDEVIYLAEVLYTRNNLGDNELAGSDYIVTDDAWAYQVRLSFNYRNVLTGLDLEVPVVFRHEVEGAAVGVNSLEDNNREFSVGVTGFYLDQWEFGLQYAQYAGGGLANGFKDRDNVSLSVKYTF